jgi:N-methylhydantoinase A
LIQAARRIVSEEFPEAFVCASHEVAPEFREYERLSTTVVNAFLGPVMAFFIRSVADRLNAFGVAVTPYLTQSNGGVIRFDTAARLPVRTVLSGPSTGAVGAQVTARLAGTHDLITLRHGRHIHRRRIDAGGRGEARPRGGGPRLSDQGPDARHPKSAGADPGPACYDRGNDEPTVTDANVVLGP